LASGCDYPQDVVHDLYIEGKKYSIENLDAWWYQSIKNRLTKPIYYNQSLPLFDLAETTESKDEDVEQAYSALDHIDEFDRTLFLLYLQGYCMTCVAEESGISRSTIYYSIKQTKQCLQAIKNSDNE
jgi:DNA-directed RNA polymerase specialized sigma24 family protein